MKDNRSILGETVVKLPRRGLTRALNRQFCHPLYHCTNASRPTSILGGMLTVIKEPPYPLDLTDRTRLWNAGRTWAANGIDVFLGSPYYVLLELFSPHLPSPKLFHGPLLVHIAKKSKFRLGWNWHPNIFFHQICTCKVSTSYHLNSSTWISESS